MENLTYQQELQNTYFDDVRMLNVTRENVEYLYNALQNLTRIKGGNILIGYSKSYGRIGLSFIDVCISKAIIEFFEYKITGRLNNFKYSIREIENKNGLFTLAVKVKREKVKYNSDNFKNLLFKNGILNEIKDKFFKEEKNNNLLVDENYKDLLEIHELNCGEVTHINELFKDEIETKDEEFLETIKMFKDDYINEKTQLICTFFDNNKKNGSKIIDQKIVKYNPVKMYKFGLDFILKYGSNGTPANKGFPYPIKAVKELLINAILHCDYSVEGKIEINVFKNRIEILNTGDYLGNEVPNTSYKDKNITYYRNGKIAEIMSKIRMTKNNGSGLKIVYDSYQNTSLTKRPIIYSKNGIFTAVLNNFYDNTSNNKGISCREKARIEKINLQKEVYKLLKDNSELTYLSIKNILNIKLSRTVFYKQIIKPLIIQNIVSKYKNKSKMLELKLNN